MKNLALVVVVGAALGCGNNPLVSGAGGSGGRGSLGGAPGGAGGGAGGGAPGGQGGLAAAGGAGGGGGQSTVPSCLQDLWVACGFSSPSDCNVDDSDGGARSVCFQSGPSYTVSAAPPCGATDAGSVEQITTFKKPDGSTCYVQRAELGDPSSSAAGCYWRSASYTWTDATGATIATGHTAAAYFEHQGGVSVTCANGGTTACTTQPDLPPLNGPCPTFTPTCTGTSGPCPYPPGASSP